jgi:hypothetical protein
MAFSGYATGSTAQGGFDTSQRHQASEFLQNREMERKLSINFGQGGLGSFIPSVSNNYG